MEWLEKIDQALADDTKGRQQQSIGEQSHNKHVTVMQGESDTKKTKNINATISSNNDTHSAPIKLYNIIVPNQISNTTTKAMNKKNKKSSKLVIPTTSVAARIKSVKTVASSTSLSTVENPRQISDSENDDDVDKSSYRGSSRYTDDGDEWSWDDEEVDLSSDDGSQYDDKDDPDDPTQLSNYDDLLILAQEPWNIPMTSSSSSNNCHGIVQIRMLKAKHLPCTPKSPIYSTLSLQPWKGAVETKPFPTLRPFEFSKYNNNNNKGIENDTNENNNDSADANSNSEENNEQNNKPSELNGKPKMIATQDIKYSSCVFCRNVENSNLNDLNFNEDDNKDYRITKTSEFLHQYNSDEDTPIPILKLQFFAKQKHIQLQNEQIIMIDHQKGKGTGTATNNIKKNNNTNNLFSKLTGGGEKDLEMCSLSLSCLPLMMRPSIWHKRWFVLQRTQEELLLPQQYYKMQNNGDAAANSLLETAEISSPTGDIPTTVVQSNNTDPDNYRQSYPIIQLELCFEPTMQSNNSSSNMNSIPRTILSSKNNVISNDSQHSIQGLKYDDNDNQNDDDTGSVTASVASTITSSSRKNMMNTKPHLYRMYSFYLTPVHCSICKKLLTQLLPTPSTSKKNTCYRCEICNLDCCVDCQLQSNLRFPCNSKKTKSFVSKQIQNQQWMSTSKLIEMVAPHKDGDDEKTRKRKKKMILQRGEAGNLNSIQEDYGNENGSHESCSSSSVNEDGKDKEDIDELSDDQSDTQVNHDNKVMIQKFMKEDGVGTLDIRIIKARSFQKSYTPETDIQDILTSSSSPKTKSGDYYVRVWSSPQDSFRTEAKYQTSGKPVFEQDLDTIIVKHYGMELKIDLIDSQTDKVVGSNAITLQQLLQKQRDETVSRYGGLWNIYKLISLNFSPKHIQQKSITLELRRNIGEDKNNNNHFFYKTSTNQENNNNTNTSTDQAQQTNSHPQQEQGEISGCIVLDITLEEFPDIFSSKANNNENNKTTASLREIPSRPPEDFSVDIIQNHIARVTAIIQVITQFFKTCQYITSWEDPTTTFLAFVVFLTMCWRVDAEYFLSIPIGMIIFYMILSWNERKSGQFEKKWLPQESNNNYTNEDENNSVVSENNMIVDKKIKKESSSNNNKQREVRKNIKDILNLPSSEMNSYIPHRPIAKICVSVKKGRNLRSLELGIPGSVLVGVIYDPARFSHHHNKKIEIEQKKKNGEDTICNSLLLLESMPIEFGQTLVSGITSNPVWKNMKETNEAMKLKRLLSPLASSLFSSSSCISQNGSDNTVSTSSTWIDFYPSSATSPNNNTVKNPPSLEWNKNHMIEFPLLQPISYYPSFEDNQSTTKEQHQYFYLKPWNTCKGAIVFQIRFDKIFNKLMMFDNHFLGEVVIPISKLIPSSNSQQHQTKGNAVEQKFSFHGWFQVQEIGSTAQTIQLQLQENEEEVKMDTEKNSSETKKSIHAKDDITLLPAIFLQGEITIPSSSPTVEKDFVSQNKISEIDKEVSHVITEEMIRMASISQKQMEEAMKKKGLFRAANMLQTLQTVRGLQGQIQIIQNTLGGVLDTVESILNLFTWASPEKSTIVFLILLFIWLVFILIPLRLIITIVGTLIFVKNFMIAYGIIKNEEKLDDTIFIKEGYEGEDLQNTALAASSSPSPLVFLQNFILSSPTSEDLRRIHFWESKRIINEKHKSNAKRKREMRLKTLWNALWYGNLQIKTVSKKSNDGQNHWDPIFGVIVMMPRQNQSSKSLNCCCFQWWSSTNCFDFGEKPLGTIWFIGHSGLAGFSPLETRELAKEGEIDTATTIFGRQDGQDHLENTRKKGNASGQQQQQKIVLLLPNENSKTLFEDAVLRAVTLSSNS